ncbi:hypothetical protein GF402_08710 [Candidatus Fermentibacteria bacterium]|nr:hypothetical protein [Candidatus Fermentibacteria bacterium]
MKPIWILSGFLLLLLVACGTNPSTPEGTLPKVEGLTVVDSLCGGNTVFLSWNSVDSVVGYRIYYDETGGGIVWNEIESVTDTFTTHEAERSYYYTVLAFTGDDTSEDYADRVHTRPNGCGTYTLWDNHAGPDSVNALILGEESGITGRADDSTFMQNVYLYDADWTGSPVGLFSGDAGVWGNGVATPLVRSSSAYLAPETGYDDSLYVIQGDYVYGMTPDSHYVKMWISEVEADTTISDSTYYAKIYYQYQPIEGLRLFALIQ